MNINIHVENEQEALTLMLYHLRLAAAYFETTPTVIPVAAIADEFSYNAICAWIVAMEALYPEDGR